MFPFYKLNESSKPTVLEASLPMTTYHDALRGHLRTALMKAHGVQNTYDSQGPWIRDSFPTHVVYSHGGQTYKRKYTVIPGAGGADTTCAMGEPKKVHTAYVDSAKECVSVLLEVPEGYVEDLGFMPAKESPVTITLSDGAVLVQESVLMFGDALDITTVQESSKKTVIPVCLIKPGWGSMAYYSKQMIQESGPSTFKKGTQMFMNHATDAEDMQRPEGDMNALAAVLNKDAYWNETGPKGPGLYSEALLFSDHADKILEKGPYTGCSINAAIKATEGTVEGRTGRVGTAFVKAYSVDFVTKAGAGGAPIVPVTESAKVSDPSEVVEESTMTDAELKVLQDENTTLKAQLRTLEAGQNRIAAVSAVLALLKEAGVTVKQSLLERVCSEPVMKEGKVDSEWAKGVVADLGDVSEAGGKVTSLGEGHQRVAEGTTDTSAADLKESLRALGVPEAGLEVAVRG